MPFPMPTPAMTSPATWSPQMQSATAGAAAGGLAGGGLAGGGLGALRRRGHRHTSRILKGMLPGAGLGYAAGALTAPRARTSSEDSKPPVVNGAIVNGATGGLIGAAGPAAYGVRGFDLGQANLSRIQNPQVLGAGLRGVEGSRVQVGPWQPQGRNRVRTSTSTVIRTDTGTAPRLTRTIQAIASRNAARAARAALRHNPAKAVSAAYAELGPKLTKEVNRAGLKDLKQKAWVSPLRSLFTPAGAPLKAHVVPRNPFKTIGSRAGLGGLIGGLAGAAGTYALER